MQRSPLCRRNRGLSLIEILVTITLIVLLIALLMPTLATTREASRAVMCMTRLKQIGSGQECYAQDFAGLFPLAYHLNTATGVNLMWPLTGTPQNYLAINPQDLSWSGPFMCPSYSAASSPRSTWDYNPSPLNNSYTVNRSLGQYLYDTSPSSFYTLNGTPWMRRPTNAKLINQPASKAVIIDGLYRDAMRLNYCADYDLLTLGANAVLDRHLNQTNNILFFDNHVQRVDGEQLNERAYDWWSLPQVGVPPF